MVSVKDQDIQRIIDLVKKNGIGELEIHDGKQVIRVQAAPQAPVRVESAPQVATQPSTPTDHTKSPPSEPTNETTINAPLVGSVYLTPSPDEPPFVKAGQILKEGQTVCLIEAMKTFNHIKSPIAGKLLEICVKNGQTVEFDKPMFVVAAT